MSFGSLLHVVGAMQTKVLIKFGAFNTILWITYDFEIFWKNRHGLGLDIEVG